MSGMIIDNRTKKRVRELAAGGVKYRDIAKRTGVSLSTVGKIAVGINQIMPINHGSVPKELLDEWDKVTGKLRKYFKKGNEA